MEISGEKLALSRGNLLAFPPDTPYWFEPLPEIELVALDFDLTQRYAVPATVLPPCPVESFDKTRVHQAPVLTDAPVLSKFIFLENASFLETKLDEIVQELLQQRLFFREKGGSLLKDLLFEIVRSGMTGEDGKDVITRILSYVDDHIGESITNRDIGEALFYNPNYLNRLMIRQTGMSLHRYILQRRLAKATRLLLTSQLSINEIASQLGFYSASHFSNFFKQETGVSPARYRKAGLGK